MLVGRVQVKDEHTALFHEKGRLGHRLLEAGRGTDVVVGVEGGHSAPDGAEQVQVQDVLPEQKQPLGDAQLVRLFPQNGQHLLRLVHPDHVVACLGEHQRQIAGAAPQVRHDAVGHAMGVQLSFHISIQRVVVRLAVQLVVKVGKFVVSHYTFTPRL